MPLLPASRLLAPLLALPALRPLHAFLSGGLLTARLSSPSLRPRAGFLRSRLLAGPLARSALPGGRLAPRLPCLTPLPAGGGLVLLLACARRSSSRLTRLALLPAPLRPLLSLLWRILFRRHRPARSFVATRIGPI